MKLTPAQMKGAVDAVRTYTDLIKKEKERHAEALKILLFCF